MRENPLAVWIDARMSRAAFARQAGMSASHLSLVLRGERGLSLKQAVAIEAATNGEIPAGSLFLKSGSTTLGGRM
jgi:DNA-binding transcriptional regulator YdaS (Cro superfamily)